ncbi:Ribonuclease H [Smittium culicis]|uniref:ribonuclease H n=1 Tax=Smittium culicis TaxID=133412 RepID=A0A1R1XGR8_9FUNG|nr:Ribonuclease H [Smittium culicis]
MAVVLAQAGALQRITPQDQAPITGNLITNSRKEVQYSLSFDNALTLLLFPLNIYFMHHSSESSYNSGYRPSQRSSYYRGGSYRKPDPVTVYTDGSCLGNGKNGSSAGVGVYFDDNDHRNVSERLDGLQTNNRAELTAIKRALETVRDTDNGNTARDVEIKSDSQYAINATTKWHSKWSSNGWKTADGGEVKNRDLIEDIAALKSERAGNVKFSYVPAHSSIHGNEKADRLAVRGAQSYE